MFVKNVFKLNSLHMHITDMFIIPDLCMYFVTHTLVQRNKYRYTQNIGKHNTIIFQIKTLTLVNNLI